jgi:splicing factor 3B subunit 1
MALDKRNYRQVVDTTVDIGQKVGAGEIIERIVINLKDDSEAYRKMSLETIEKLISSLGAADISERLEERLIDGLLFAFQEQSVEDIILLNSFGTIVNSLGTRTKPYVPQIASTILYRLNHKSPSVRQQAADLISRVAVVIQQCEEGPLLTKIGTVLYEYLGEEYPEVLGSILGALRGIVTVIGLETMQPPVRDLLPRLTPILRNRHEKVQENTIDLVGRIADRGAESVPSREWMRICFELLDMLKAHKKGIRRAANNTFGFIAKAIGPSDVLATLLVSRFIPLCDHRAILTPHRTTFASPNVNHVCVLPSLSVSSPRLASLSPSSLRSCPSIECLSSTFRMVFSRRLLSSLNILARCPRTTSML